LYEYKEDKIMK